MLFFVLITMLFLSACGHPKAAHVEVPPPPASEAETVPSTAQPAPNIPSTKEKTSHPAANVDLGEPALPARAKPIASETGLASWYGPPYHNRRVSIGQIF
jgi:rare lipoprotein A